MHGKRIDSFFRNDVRACIVKCFFWFKICKRYVIIIRSYQQFHTQGRLIYKITDEKCNRTSDNHDGPDDAGS